MTEGIQTIIVGAGQAGLALSYCLTQRGHEHLILERGRVAERWRSERWDSFTLLSPRWHSRLPGYRYEGDDPDGFMDRQEIVRYLEGYAGFSKAPVRLGSAVTTVRRDEDTQRYFVEVNGGEATFEAQNVVVAIGGHQWPHLPAVAAALSGRMFQIHTNDYRGPEQLPPGGVLVVGSGTSGQQIAEELIHSGRQTFLSVGRHAKLPRRYRGRDIVWWLDQTGVFDETADQAPSERRRPAAALTGIDRGHDLDLRHLAAQGVTLLGHLKRVAEDRLLFLPDLERSLASGDQVEIDFKRRVDDHVLAHRLDAPWEEAELQPNVSLNPIDELDLQAEGITSVIWCTGYAYDLDWLQLPVRDPTGEPVHRRGVTPFPGLYFLGLRWLWKRKSSFIDGVGEDAIYLADQLQAR